MFDIAHYEDAHSVRHAIELLQAHPQAKLIAGGTDLLLHIREGKLPDAELISIHNMGELVGVCQDPNDTIIIKPVTTFSQLAEHPIIQKHLPFLGQAARSVGGPQTRHAGTIGGNICSGATSADCASTLFALNAQLQITGPTGTRFSTMPDFYLGPGKVALQPAEILTAICISPTDYQGFGGHYIKHAIRKTMDIATLGCVVLCKVQPDNIIADFRLALGVAAPVPMRCLKTEAAVKGLPFNEQLLETVGRLAVTEVNPRSSWRASSEYRIHLVEELSKRAFREAFAQAGGTII